MKSYYEKHRDDSPEVNLMKYTSHVFPAHFHKNIEICALEKGELELSINDKIYRMTAGQIAVIDSFDVHEYVNSTKEDFSDCVLVVPYEFLGDLLVQRRNFKIANPIVEDAELCEKILRLSDEFLSSTTSERVKKATSRLIMELLLEKLPFEEDGGRGEVALIRKILVYLQENFKSDVSRKRLAAEFGYAEAHLSRVFHRYFRTGISSYVNGLRLNFVEQKLAENGKERLIELIYEAGFNCPQTYYRAKQKLMENGKN